MSYRSWWLGSSTSKKLRNKKKDAEDLDELRRKVVRNVEGSTLGRYTEPEAFSRVPNEFNLQLQAVAVPFRAVCTITKEPFSGIAYIAVEPNRWCMEYISLEDWIKGLRNEVCTHEELTNYIYSGVQLTLELSNQDHMLIVLVVQESVHVPALAAVGNLMLWAFRPKEVRDVTA